MEFRGAGSLTPVAGCRVDTGELMGCEGVE